MKTHRSSLSELQANSKPQHKWWLWTVAAEVSPSFFFDHQPEPFWSCWEEKEDSVSIESKTSTLKIKSSKERTSLCFFYCYLSLLFFLSMTLAFLSRSKTPFSFDIHIFFKATNPNILRSLLRFILILRLSLISEIHVSLSNENHYI